MPSFFEAMIQSVQSKTLPFSLELNIVTSLPGHNWEALSIVQQDSLIDGVKQFFLESDKNTYIRFNPLLTSASVFYRPVRKLPESVIRTLLSGEQDLISMDETGESCQWRHVFVENDGVGTVSFVHHMTMETSRKKPRNSRSRSRSRGKTESSQKEDNKRKKRSRRRSLSTSPPRQISDEKTDQKQKKKKVTATRRSYERQNQATWWDINNGLSWPYLYLKDFITFFFIKPIENHVYYWLLVMLVMTGWQGPTFIVRPPFLMRVQSYTCFLLRLTTVVLVLIL